MDNLLAKWACFDWLIRLRANKPIAACPCRRYQLAQISGWESDWEYVCSW